MSRENFSRFLQGTGKESEGIAWSLAVFIYEGNKVWSLGMTEPMIGATTAIVVLLARRLRKYLES